jgi:ribosome recycling factor
MLDDQFKAIIDESRVHMQKAVDHLQVELSHLRAGRANAAMLDGVRVEAYGSHMPINQVANVSAPQHDMILVQPWDKSTLKAVERGIVEANLGLNPTNDGTLIRITIPPLTEERRRELAKSARSKGEDAKVAVRNVRRDGKEHIKRTYDGGHLPEDMRFEAEEQLQKATDEFVGKVDSLLEKKEQEIMAV